MDMVVTLSSIWFLLLIFIVISIVFQLKFRWHLLKATLIYSAVMLVLAVFFMPSTPQKQTAQAASKKDEQHLVIPKEPAETKEQFIASTKLIGLKDSPVYWKEFLKNPDKFSGERLKVRAKILEIEESQGQTVIQAYISNDYDMIIILHPDSIPFYKDDQIWVYGIGGGSFEAQNRMGATMSWPIIYSKYVEEFKNM